MRALSNGTMVHATAILEEDITDRGFIDESGWLVITAHSSRDGVLHEDTIMVSPRGVEALRAKLAQ